MPNKPKFNDAEIRGMEAMRRMGKSYKEIARVFECSDWFVRCTLNPELRQKTNEQIKRSRLRRKKNIYDRGKERMWIEQPKGKGSLANMRRTSTNTCHITCCSEWDKCQDKEAPQDCLVWRMMMNDRLVIIGEDSKSPKVRRDND